uniref:CBS domain-containing protein n=1 Tax=Eutreptiella gymnastica TaxID=73025 RepID=A0A7S1HRT8_9EUGL
MWWLRCDKPFFVWDLDETLIAMISWGPKGSHKSTYSPGDYVDVPRERSMVFVRPGVKELLSFVKDLGYPMVLFSASDPTHIELSLQAAEIPASWFVMVLDESKCIQVRGTDGEWACTKDLSRMHHFIDHQQCILIDNCLGHGVVLDAHGQRVQQNLFHVPDFVPHTTQDHRDGKPPDDLFRRVLAALQLHAKPHHGAADLLEVLRSSSQLTDAEVSAGCASSNSKYSAVHSKDGRWMPGGGAQGSVDMLHSGEGNGTGSDYDSGNGSFSDDPTRLLPSLDQEYSPTGRRCRMTPLHGPLQREVCSPDSGRAPPPPRRSVSWSDKKANIIHEDEAKLSGSTRHVSPVMSRPPMSRRRGCLKVGRLQMAEQHLPDGDFEHVTAPSASYSSQRKKYGSLEPHSPDKEEELRKYLCRTETWPGRAPSTPPGETPALWKDDTADTTRHRNSHTAETFTLLDLPHPRRAVAEDASPTLGTGLPKFSDSVCKDPAMLLAPATCLDEVCYWLASVRLVDLTDSIADRSLHQFEAENMDALSPVKKGFQKLAQAGLQSCLITDERGEYVDMLDVNDLLQVIVEECERQVGKSVVDKTWMELAHILKPKSAWFDVPLLQYFKSHEHPVHNSSLRKFIGGITSDTPLLSIISDGLLSGTGPLPHEIPVVIHHQPRILSSFDVMVYLARNLDMFGSARTLTLQQLGLAKKHVIAVSRETPTIEALYQMHRSQVSSLAVTDIDGRLVATLSVSDLRGFVCEDFPFLALQVEKFLNTRRLRRPRGSQEDGAARSPSLSSKTDKPFAATPSTSLEEAITRLASVPAMRLYLVDPQWKPVSVVSATDILRLIAGQSSPLPTSQQRPC